jgi:multiple antibiotic resistance protein
MEVESTFFITAFISIIAIINPLSTIGLFLSLTRNAHPVERNKIAFMSSLAAFLVLVFFALTGYLVFQIYSITIEAFRIAGGAILLIIGMRMTFPGKDSAHGGASEYAGKHIYIVPLAIPMTSGPGAISTAVVLASQASSALHEVALFIAFFLACAINYIVLRFSSAIYKKIGPDAVEAMIKIMGLLVCAVAVQFMINGLKVAFPILG